MGYLLAILLAIAGIWLFRLVKKGRIHSESLQIAANIAGILALLAATLVFIIPAAQGNNIPASHTSTSVATIVFATTTEENMVLPTSATQASGTNNPSTPTTFSISSTVATSTLTKPTIPLEFVGDSVAVMRDMDGNVVNLATFVVQCRLNFGHLRYSGGLDDIYAWINAIPLLQNKKFDANQVEGDAVAIFVSFDKINEYYFDGQTATINLLNGGSLTGAPLSNCSYSGQSSVGQISAYTGDIQALRFNQGNLPRLLEQNQQYHVNMDGGWPEQFESRADITLNTGETLNLQNLAFVYIHWTRGGTWWQPVTYQNWELEQVIPVQFGAFTTTVPFSDIEGIEANAELSSQGFSLKLRSGEQMQAMMYCGADTFGGNGCAPKAFLGSVDYGYVHLELDAIKTIVFRDH